MPTRSKFVARISLLLVFCAVPPLLAQSGERASTGALVLLGGGKSPPAVIAKFMELAGAAKGNIIVIPTALEERDLTPERLAGIRETAHRLFGPSATVLHTRDAAVANSAEFVEPIRHATGVWVIGGDEHLLAAAYVGTRVEKEIRALFERGGVVGGTSAGAIIQGSVLPDGKADASSPVGFVIRGIMPAFDLLPKSIVMPHWSQRKLNFEMLKAMLAKNPGLLGIGIDEDTAAVVQGRVLEVIGEHKVGIYDGAQHDGRNYLLLGSGDSFDLGRRGSTAPARQESAR